MASRWIYEVSVNGAAFTFVRGQWTRGNLLVPKSRWPELNAALIRDFKPLDLEHVPTPELWELVQVFDEMNAWSHAAHGLLILFFRIPRDKAVRTQLSSVLRHLDRSDLAVKVTDGDQRWADAPFLTTRAAALCDIGEWELARDTIRRAIAKDRSHEALMVLNRIRSNRPDLW